MFFSGCSLLPVLLLVSSLVLFVVYLAVLLLEVGLLFLLLLVAVLSVLLLNVGSSNCLLPKCTVRVPVEVVWLVLLLRLDFVLLLWMVVNVEPPPSHFQNHLTFPSGAQSESLEGDWTNYLAVIFNRPTSLSLPPA